MNKSEGLHGVFRIFRLYDVAEKINLGALRRRLAVSAERREPSFPRHTPPYLTFEDPPVIEPIECLLPGQPPALRGRIKYYANGVVSLEWTLQFEGTWQQLIENVGYWARLSALDIGSKQVARVRLEEVTSSLNSPYDEWLTEDYCILVLDPIVHEGRSIPASVLLKECSDEVTRIVRTETRNLSTDEQDRVLHAALSYYTDDLVVAGWTSAFLYGAEAETEPILQLLEFANSQLLVYRRYDLWLDTILANAYGNLEKGVRVRFRWTLARQAEELNTARLDVQELIERTDWTLKFIGDVYYAQVYRVAAVKIGVAEYRDLVEAKLQTASTLYDFMVNEFHQGRAFILESAIVAILIIDLFFLFREAFGA